MSIIKIGLASFLRLLANHCILPSLRVWLFRRSGLHIGRDVTINLETKFIDNWQPGLIELGDRVSMGPLVCLVADAMPNQSRLSQHGVTQKGKITIQEDAWIGAGAIIMPGVTVGRFAIVGAGSVVTRDVAPFAVVAGSPARVLKKLEPADPPDDPGN